MLEDYTELIADLIAANGEARTTDIARRLGVAHPTASKTIARLKREGLARAQPYRGIFLTEAGAAMAKSARQRHRLVVDLLVAVGTPREAAEADAEGIEHYVSAARHFTPSRRSFARATTGRPHPASAAAANGALAAAHLRQHLLERRRRSAKQST